MKKIWASLDPFFEPGPILGRKIANANFLTYLLKTDYFDEYHFFLSTFHLKDYLHDFLQQHFTSFVPKIKIFTHTQLHKHLQKYSYFCFHLSDCINYPQYLASLRNFLNKDFPITSITHSLSYNNFIYAYLSHLSPCWGRQDAIIATSYSGKRVLKNFYRYLTTSLGLASNLEPPNIKVIPLGIEEKFFDYKKNKLELRKKLNLPLTEPLLLYLGRISYTSKIDLVPLLRTLKLVQDKNQQKINLILAGQTTPKENALEDYTKLAHYLNLNLFIFPDISEEKKLELLNASDIFLSLIDNYQETFGLSILEAKASSLLVIASNFDGYKELIKDKEDGFLIPTYAPKENLLLRNYRQLLSDTKNHFLLSQNVSFDFKYLVDTLTDVLNNKNLRKDIGQKAKENTVKYLWTNIIKEYILLWENLNKQKSIKKDLHPLNFPAFELFSHYPSKILNANTVLKTSNLGQKILKKIDIPTFYSFLDDFINLEHLEILLQEATQTQSINSLLQKLSPILKILPEELSFLIYLALKQGFLELVP